MINITAPIEKTDRLVLRMNIATATMGEEEYDISLSVPPNSLVFKTPRGKYLVKIEDLIADILKMEKGGMFDAP